MFRLNRTSILTCLGPPIVPHLHLIYFFLMGVLFAVVSSDGIFVRGGFDACVYTLLPPWAVVPGVGFPRAVGGSPKERRK